jgi:hypothetical protein
MVCISKSASCLMPRWPSAASFTLSNQQPNRSAIAIYWNQLCFYDCWRNVVSLLLHGVLAGCRGSTWREASARSAPQGARQRKAVLARSPATPASRASVSTLLALQSSQTIGCSALSPSQYIVKDHPSR